MPDIILVSGGFDPVHSGHIKLINDANKYGDVVVLLNSDAWLRNKKGKEFLSFDERKIIMQNIKGVVENLAWKQLFWIACRPRACAQLSAEIKVSEFIHGSPRIKWICWGRLASAAQTHPNTGAGGQDDGS